MPEPMRKFIAITAAVVTGLALIISPLLLLISALPAMAAGFGMLSGIVAPVGIAVAVIGGLVAAGVLLYKNWDVIKAKAVGLWTGLTDTFNAIKTGVTNAITSTKEGFLNALNGMKTGTATIVNGIIGIFNKMISGLNKLAFKVPDWVPKIGGNDFGFNIPEIPKLKIDGSHYHGLDYVPRNNYVANLHKGERVQTAREAKESRQGIGMRDVNITVQNMNVRQESDIEDIANKLAIKVMQASMAGA